MPETRLQQMMKAVGGSCKCRSHEDVQKIAELCIENNWCAWHGFSKFYNLPCCCFNCYGPLFGKKGGLT